MFFKAFRVNEIGPVTYDAMSDTPAQAAERYVLMRLTATAEEVIVAVEPEDDAARTTFTWQGDPPRMYFRVTAKRTATAELVGEP